MIFQHENPGDGPGERPWLDREELTIEELSDGRIDIRTFNGVINDFEDSSWTACTLDRMAALALYEALGQVLYP